MNFKLFLVFFCALIPFFNGYGSNFHEHLFSLPTPDNILASSGAIFALPEKQQRLSLIFNTDGDLHRFIRCKQGVKLADDFLKRGGISQTLTDLCTAMGKTQQEGFASVLAFDVSEESSLEEKQRLYVDLEEVRKMVVLSLPCSEVEKIFARYFEEEKLLNRQVISATVTRRFFDLGQDNKYLKLKALAARYGSNLVYRVSLQRMVLLEEGIAFNPEVLALIESGEIGGIDIVGSLGEKQYVYPQSQEVIEEQLLLLFNYISDRSLVLVFHLFEALNNDLFYKALEKTLRAYRRSLFLEVGHIAHLNEHWIDVFAANPSLKVLFHVNLCSNQVLQGRSLAEIKQTVESLLSLGFPVVPGCDGRGILPGASYLEQVNLLGCALHHKSFLSAQKLPVKPIPHACVPPKMGSSAFQWEGTGIQSLFGWKKKLFDSQNLHETTLGAQEEFCFETSHY